PPRTEGTEFSTQLEKETPYSQQQHIYDKSRPENLNFLKKLRAMVDTYEDKVLIGEIGDDHPYARAKEYTAGSDTLHSSYNTHLMSGVHKELTELSIRTPIETFFQIFQDKESAEISINWDSWPSWAFSNHDVVRAASRWFKPYDHNPKFSKMLIALLGCLPGTLFLYQGEELGLPEAEIPHESIRDPWAKETWPEWQGRDGCRTPMVWSEGKYCGFSNFEPWLPIPRDHENLNYERQKAETNSVLNFTKKFLEWRKNNKEIFQSNFKFCNTSYLKIIHIVYRNKKIDTNCIFNVGEVNVPYKGYNLEPCDFIIDGFSDH
ncbi:MAG: alpha-glucosidase, partial [Alphaproteobacteria bacterium]|nr:alpha-glucosidase [Alphaproteobacteria bacterium]